MNKNKNNHLEQRAFLFDVRADKREDGISIITGRPIVYNSRTDLGWFDEIIEEGALNNTDLTDVRFLVNHDLSKIPLARSRRNNGNSTMRLSPDNQGMAIEVELDTENNVDSKALYSAVSRGDITGMSFMFSIKDAEWDDLDSDHPTRRIKAISSVVEVSAVTFPAYDATEINARSKEALESARQELESARKEKRAQSVDTDNLELAKAKLNFMSKL